MSEPNELSTRRQATARRAAESKATIPHLQVRATADLTEARDDLPLEARVVAACGAALRKHAHLNGSYRDGRLEEHSHVNVAVTIDGPEGPQMPTIADADGKDPAEIAREIAQLRERARDAEIPPSELSGATFTVAVLGPEEASDFEAVIVPPQAGILAVGAIEQRPAVRDGSVVPAPSITLTLGCDARLVSATEAAGFLGSVREALERA